MTVSIVIRTYNEEKFLSKLLGGIVQQSLNPYEIIVVDSGSTDSSLRIARDFDCKIAQIEKENFSFGRSLNLGCQIAEGDIFVFVSAHCIPKDENWLKELVRPFEDEKTALSYGRQIGNELSKFSEHQVFKKYFPDTVDKAQGGFFCNNANSAIRRELWKLRKFNEELTGLEDMDWAKHYFRSGHKIVYCPKSIIYHIHEESWPKVKNRYEREAYALKEIMPEIHFNFKNFISSFYFGVKQDLWIALKRRKVLKFIIQIMFFRFCQFYGVYRGNHIHRKLSKKKMEKYFYP